MNKAILILVDGMRPDSFMQAGEAQTLMQNSTWCLQGRTVYPSVTLPCHMSLFYSVEPGRHGTVTNLYMPQVRPIDGLFEKIHAAGKKTAMFYSWDPLRDIARPGAIDYSLLINGYAFTHEQAQNRLTKACIEFVKTEDPDFVFLYLGAPDEAGHAKGWMSLAYLQAVAESLAHVDRIVREFGDRRHILVTADHGGHDRGHGTDLPQDMTIPLFIAGPGVEKNRRLETFDIQDITPTLARLLQVAAAPEWEGQILL